LLIDSPIDGITGVQSIATRKIESRLGDLVRKKYPQFSLQPFTPAIWSARAKTTGPTRSIAAWRSKLFPARN